MFLLNSQSIKLFLSKPQKAARGKFRILNFEFRTSRQAGVTLLLAILILSSVLAISFSLATIMFIEVRSSGDLIRTEPALYAATGVGEQAFFNLERHACTGTGGTCSYTTNFSNNVTMPVQPTILSTSTPIFTDKIKGGSDFHATLNKYDFVTSGALGSKYGKVTVNYITTNSSNNVLYAYLCQFDPNRTDYLSVPCTTVNTSVQDQGYWKAPDDSGVGSLNIEGSVSMTSLTNSSVSWTLDPNLQQQLILTNLAGSGDIYVKIATYADQAGTIGKGLPYIGKTAVGINTINASVGRKIQVEVPNKSSGSSGGSSGGGTTPWRTLTTNSVYYTNSDYNMGYSFTLNKSGKITQLAMRLNDTAVHTVWLYACNSDCSSGSVVASVNLTGAGDNGYGLKTPPWVVGDITPVSVTSGSRYVVSVRVNSGKYGFENASYPQTIGDITVNGSRYNMASDAFPTLGTVDPYMYGPADVTFVAN